VGFVDKLSKTNPIIKSPKLSDKDKLSPLEAQAYSRQEIPDAEKISQWKLNAAIEKHKVQIDGIRQDQDLRDKYASKAYGFVWLWSFILFLILILTGLKNFFGFEITFELSDSVLIALISGVTINILAVFLAVMNNLFPKKASAITRTKPPNQQKPKAK
jgi:hypothetical protein